MSAPNIVQEGAVVLRSGSGGAILIDFDRTLVNLYPDRRVPLRLRSQIIAEVLSLGVESSLLEPFTSIEDGYHLWSELVTAWRSSPHAAALRSMDELFLAAEMEATKRCEVATGALSLVRSGKRCGAAIAVVTSNHALAVELALQRHGLREYVDEIVGRPVPICPQLMKPSSFPVHLALKALRVDGPGRAYLIGDSVVDMAAATAAGCRAIGVATGDYTERQLIDSGARAVVSDLAHIALESMDIEVVSSGE